MVLGILVESDVVHYYETSEISLEKIYITISSNDFATALNNFYLIQNYESFENGAIRELKEETGIDIDASQLKYKIQLNQACYYYVKLDDEIWDGKHEPLV